MSGLAQGSTLAAPRTASLAGLRRREARRAVAPTPERAARHVLDESLFRDAVVRQSRRADRFEESFLFARITFAASGNFDVRLRSRRPEPVEGRTSKLDKSHTVSALSHVALDTDIVGWIRRGTELGLVRPLGRSADDADVKTDVVAVRDELVRVLALDGTCAIDVEVHRPMRASAPTRPLDGPLRQRSAREVAYDATKRALDAAGSAVLLVLLSPVVAAIAVLVKATSHGPIFFRQERIGRYGRPFRMLKFRTMYVDSDPAIHREYVETFIQSGTGRAEERRGVYKIVDDPRMTRIGHVLRRSSLDEVPQFWNVLVGEMSLVGPRPPVLYEVSKYKSWHLRRVLEVKPGMTGLWQVTGRSQTTFDEMVRLDLRYARHRSLWMDLKILAATPRAVLSGKGAH
jgi:lipopolysaccharide/colanic/teichoic acid biosynthesis glycosyltransferase